MWNIIIAGLAGVGVGAAVVVAALFAAVKAADYAEAGLADVWTEDDEFAYEWECALAENPDGKWDER